MPTLNNIAAKRDLVEVKDLQVKKLRLLVVDSNKAEVRFPEHSVPSDILDDVFRAAFNTFGEVKHAVLKTKGFVGAISTIRLVRMVLKDGTTLESLTHKLPIIGVNLLLYVPWH